MNSLYKFLKKLFLKRFEPFEDDIELSNLLKRKTDIIEATNR
jgi:hypothetical protein